LRTLQFVLTQNESSGISHFEQKKNKLEAAPGETLKPQQIRSFKVLM